MITLVLLNTRRVGNLLPTMPSCLALPVGNKLPTLRSIQ